MDFLSRFHARQILLASAASFSLFAPAASATAQDAKVEGATITAPASGGFADIFARVAPAVVSITVNLPSSENEAQSAQDPPFPFNQLPQFLPRPRRRGPDRDQGQDAAPDGGDDAGPERQAAGSGFFISADGFIVTNNHVVEGATKITVLLNDGRELAARLIGRDEATDIAVVKVEGPAFAYVSFETQIKPRVGDWVMAVGNPLQLGGTATAGIVSYVGRDLADLRTPLTDFLQISAPITFGNSGGPSFDSYGRVIGVNTAIAAQGGQGGGGIGFAIPADVAEDVAHQLISGQTIRRGYLGATIQGLDSESTAALGLPPNTGAEIAALVSGGPGDRAGLQVGDIVLSLNGRNVVSSTALTRAVSQVRAGDVFKLGVRRGGRDIVLQVRAGVRPTEEALNAGRGAAQPGARDPEAQDGKSANQATVLGLTITSVTPALRRELGLSAGDQGLAVVSVRPGSDAERKGVRSGDVVLQANQQRVATAGDLAAVVAAARTAGRRSVFLLISRQGQATGLPLRLDGSAKE